jgi:hypothetical protein
MIKKCFDDMKATASLQSFQDAFERVCIDSAWQEGDRITPATHCWSPKDDAAFTLVGHQKACEVRLYHLARNLSAQVMVAFVGTTPLTGYGRVPLVDAQWHDTAFEALQSLHHQGIHSASGNSTDSTPYLRN